jgi:broad specificity phosphatase PhoE
MTVGIGLSSIEGTIAIMTELIVMRHGETDWNRQHRFQGQIDVPLNAAGRAQAERLAQRLAHETFDVPPELEAELLESIAQAERGETLSADDVLRRLRRTS